MTFSSNSYTNSLGTISTITSIGGLNNINNQVFQNNDRYIYYTEPLLVSGHQVTLPPIGTNTDTVNYQSYISPLYVYNESQGAREGVQAGTFKVNRFDRARAEEDISTVTFLGTLITLKGNLVINYAGDIVTSSNIDVINQNLVTNAIYKSGDYSKYINVRVSIDVQNNEYRIITISY